MKLHNRFLTLNRRFENRPLTRNKFQSKPHRIGHCQDVGEENRGIQIKAIHRLQRHFRGVFGRMGQIQEAPRLLARCPVLRKEPSCLTHQPDRRIGHGFLLQRLEKIVINKFCHGEIT